LELTWLFFLSSTNEKYGSFYLCAQNEKRNKVQSITSDIYFFILVLFDKCRWYCFRYI